jgi:hypothetical protein
MSSVGAIAAVLLPLASYGSRISVKALRIATLHDIDAIIIINVCQPLT